MPTVPKIRPVSDLRNKFSMEAYEHNLFDSEVYFKLKEAEYQAASTQKRFSHEKAMVELRKIIG